MGALRDRMIRELQLRRLQPATQKAYLEAVTNLTKHFRIAPDQLSARQVQDYVLYLLTESGQVGHHDQFCKRGLRRLIHG